MKYTAIILMLLAVLSRIFGFIREILMSNYYGTSPIADIVVIALAVPTVLFAFLFSSLNTSFIPTYNSIKQNKGEVDAEKFTANLSNVVFVFSILLCIAGIIFAPQLVFAMASGFKGEKFNITVDFVRIVFLGCSFNTIAAIYCGYLNIHNSFILPSLRLAVQNIILIIFTIISVFTDIYVLAIGILVSTILQNVVVVYGLKKVKYKHRFNINLKDENINKILLLAFPLMIGVAVDQINTFVDKTLASRALDGGVSILNYADRINALMFVVITSVVTIAYPVISKCAIQNNMVELKKNVLKYVQVILIFCIPVVVAFIVFSEQIVGVIYERGVFTHKDTIEVSKCLIVYGFTLLGVSFREIISRTFYSLGDSKTPVINGIVMVVLNVGISVYLAKVIGLQGIALGTSIASILGGISLLLMLRNKIGSFNIKNLAIESTKITIFSVISVATVKVVFDNLLDLMSTEKSLFIVIVLAMVIYFAMIVFFNISSSRDVWTSAKKRLSFKK